MLSATVGVHIVAATVGFLSFFLIWLAVVWGLILRNGWALTRIRHSTIYGAHQTTALLGLTLGLVHALAQLAVPGGSVTWLHTVVPFLNAADPVGIGVGVISLELFVAASISILIQRRLGYTRWRALHTFTYTAFMLLVAHILISGTDVVSVWVWGSVLGAWLVTVALWLTTTTWMRGLRKTVVERSAGRERGQEINVNVDAQRCARFGFCEQEAPDVFQLRGDGRLIYRPAVPTDAIDGVIRAVEVCPARAIAITSPPTSVLTPPKLQSVPDTEPRNGRRPTLSGVHRLDTPQRNA